MAILTDYLIYKGGGGRFGYNEYNILQMNLNLKTNESTLFFSCKFSNKKCIILPADMAAFSRGCKARINLCKISCQKPKKTTDWWIRLNGQVIVKVPYCEINVSLGLDEFILTTIILFQAEVLKGFTVIILLLSPDKNVDLQIRGTLLKHIFRPIKYYHIARWHKRYSELAQRWGSVRYNEMD